MIGGDNNRGGGWNDFGELINGGWNKRELDKFTGWKIESTNSGSIYFK